MDRKILLVGFVSLVVVAAATLIALLFSKSGSFRGAAYSEPYPPAPYFELTHSNGELIRLSDYRGKIVLLFFGYTFCPDVCPATLAELNMALNEIPEQADAVQVLYVSVDPDRDSPQIIQEYVERFNPSFIGLSGSFSELEKIWQDYDIFREVVTSDSNIVTVSHTARVILIDHKSNMRLSYAFGTPVEDIVFDLKLMLENPE